MGLAANNIGRTTPTIPTTYPSPKFAKPSPKASGPVGHLQSAEAQPVSASGISAPTTNQSVTRSASEAPAARFMRATRAHRHLVSLSEARDYHVKEQLELHIVARTA